ncbi:hypothetical protein PMAYCL1PPCAC_04129, partial [Pristionchus mayeri]
LRHKHRLSLDCNNYKSELGVPYDYQLHIALDDTKRFKSSNLECDFDDSRTLKYMYKVNNGTNDVLLDEKFNA